MEIKWVTHLKPILAITHIPWFLLACISILWWFQIFLDLIIWVIVILSGENFCTQPISTTPLHYWKISASSLEKIVHGPLCLVLVTSFNHALKLLGRFPTWSLQPWWTYGYLWYLLLHFGCQKETKRFWRHLMAPTTCHLIKQWSAHSWTLSCWLGIVSSLSPYCARLNFTPWVTLIAYLLDFRFSFLPRAIFFSKPAPQAKNNNTCSTVKVQSTI